MIDLNKASWRWFFGLPVKENKRKLIKVHFQGGMKMNILIGKYQFFTGSPFWIGSTNFEKSILKSILHWQLGLGFLRINKYKSRLIY